MKFNLKQRRRMIKDDEEIQSLEKREIIGGYEEWFEGLEKELRSMQVQNVDDLRVGNVMFVKGFQYALKEILGES